MYRPACSVSFVSGAAQTYNKPVAPAADKETNAVLCSPGLSSPGMLKLAMQGDIQVTSTSAMGKCDGDACGIAAHTLSEVFWCHSRLVAHAFRRNCSS